MKTSMKLIATLAAAAVLAGCQTMGGYNPGSAGRFAQYHCSGSAPSMPDENTMIFKPAKQTCGGSTFGQRNEIVGNTFFQWEKKKLVMTANISLTAPNLSDTTIFQIASMTEGCSPASSFIMTEFGTKIRSGYLTKGSNRCAAEFDFKRARTDGRTIVPHDGTPFDLKVEFNFKGKGAFDYMVYMDGKRIDTFRYTRPAESKNNKEYALKFGLYSQKYFDYTLVVKNFRVDEVDKLSDEFYAEFN